MLASSTLNTKIYLGSGIPEGTDDLAITTGFKLDPVLLSVTPNTGSLAGSVIQAAVSGVGVNTKNISLFATVNGSDVNICAVSQVKSYGILECQTKAMAIEDGPLKVKILQDPVVYTCSGSSETACNYKTGALLAVSTVTAASATTLNIQGTGFNYESLVLKPNVSYAGIYADQVTVNSDTEIVAVFSSGIPLSQITQQPVVMLKSAT